MRYLSILFFALLILPTFSTEAAATTYYIGDFTGASASDDSTCGLGKGIAPEPHPCATLAWFNRYRRSVLVAGDVVRLAPGVYAATATDNYHCIPMQAGLTWEGRTAADEPAAGFTEVVIDSSNTGSTDICYGRGVTCPSASGCDASGFTVRDLTLRDGSAQGVKIDVPSGLISSGLTFERIRIAGFGKQGMNISNQPSDVDCASTGRRVRDLLVRDSLIEGNHGVFGGIAVNCVDGFAVEGNVVHDNTPAGCTWEDCRSGACNCNDHDGIQFGGAINGTIRANRVYRCGEDCIDVGGHWRKTYNVTVENNWVSDGASRWSKISGGVRNITLRNNYFTGHGNVEIGTCEENIRLYNNTLWRDDNGLVLKLWTACHQCEIVNNIIRGSLTSSAERLVMVSRASTDEGLRWSGNLLSNPTGIGYAIREDLGRGNCGNCNCDGMCEPPSWCPDPWPAAQPNTGLTVSELSTFQAEGDQGYWFGAESGDTDRWGADPAVLDAGAPSARNLHLDPADTVAADRGVDPLAGASCTAGVCASGSPGALCAIDADCIYELDYDGELRLAPWDIGADEVGAAPPTTLPPPSTTIPPYVTTTSTTARPPTTTTLAPPTGPWCGDGICGGPEENEDCSTCAIDCRCSGKSCSRGCCGDGVCSGNEKIDSCPVDCSGGGTPPTTLPPGPGTCGDGVCAGAEFGEDCASCAADCRCQGKGCARACCGDGVCEGSESSKSCATDCR